MNESTRDSATRSVHDESEKNTADFPKNNDDIFERISRFKRVLENRSELFRSELLSTQVDVLRGKVPEVTLKMFSNLTNEPKIPQMGPKSRLDVRNSLICLQKWEGYVTEISQDSFYARLRDLTHPGISEDAEFSFSQVSGDDYSLLRVGAFFYWSIGYFTDSTGRRRTVSEIRLRRLPAWTPEEYNEAALEAKEIANLLGGSQTHSQRS